MSSQLSGAAAIVGIGATEFSKNSGRSELQLACEAIVAALADAGIDPAEVDGLSTFTAETNGEAIVARNTGLGELKFFSRIGYGGGAACATVQQAAMAVATGVADVVVCYRAFNERSGTRYGLGQHDRPMDSTADRAAYAWLTPQGLSTPAQWVAMFARRYMHEYGATSEDFGRVAVVARAHAAVNPAAWFYNRPITLEDHQSSRWIAEPLHLLDCCQETDGGQALVIVSAERARDLKHAPAIIRGAAQGSGRDQHMMASYYRPEITGIPEMGVVAKQLYGQSGLTPADISAAILYDHFTPLVLPQLEELGFCGRGEAKDFIREGNLDIGGSLPTNTHGGQLGEAYLHGVNGIAEAVRLLRGTSTTQPNEVNNVLVTAGTAVPTSGLILGREQ
ncbi:lipid-transfer protein [Rhodococcus sp. PAMC28707]|uniref:lipid-transfer protein n=1 Tax=unclassified Rhodococcus (in: high G+C Gram-positive bacteria) TaxID=192944 RepID=UPI00109DEBD0|nr:MULTISPECIES: lipid-transfer protein [unclassified Rhodococcus (in: high G+C Gram-positive bacteria)]QCB50240.1 lipid-transfer protein [Rhodococcus sp. PAMC28705]QCB58068.1 lipid-transfer protein [Rhodococcus sp. PAMC28707]